MRLTPDNTELWMVNYRRWEECNTSCLMWLRSFPFKRINIIANHSDQTLDNFDQSIRDKINIVYNNVRPNWMMGSLAQGWNIAYLHAFSNPETEWVICSQDDVNVFPGWDKAINNSNFLSYWSPQGDVIHAINRKAFLRVGWWDERFRIIKCQEQDYMIRCFANLGPENISVVDNHQWEMRHNDVGMLKFWKKHYRTDEIIETEFPAEIMFMTQYEYFKSKWGTGTNEIMFGKLWNTKKLIEDIDWYPSWTLHMKQMGLLPAEFAFPK